MNKWLSKTYRKLTAGLLLCGMLFTPLLSMGTITARADEIWPYPGGNIVAEAAIVMDADTQAVLWGRNQDAQYCPASITKMMTALVVLEHCNLSDPVTVTANAVYGLESGATICGLMENEVVTVEDLLYALMLRSANDAANALAIHVAGSITDFADLMNAKAAELGCKHTNFRNPSGLTDDAHVTTAYDMALIADACIGIDSFMEIESHDSYRMPANEKNPDGFVCKMGHKMLKSGTDYSDDRVIAGKTGYIKASGNTLVTVAEENGRRVIVVVLKDKNPEHYQDTAALLNFGFNWFDTVTLEDPVSACGVAERLKADKIVEGKDSHIIAEGPLKLTVPKNYREEDLQYHYDYNITASAPEMAVAKLYAVYEERRVGSVYILNDRESSLEIVDVEAGEKREGSHPIMVEIPWKLIGILAAALVIGVLVLLKVLAVRRDKKRRAAFHERHRKRLEAMGVSEEEFNSILEKRLKKEKDAE